MAVLTFKVGKVNIGGTDLGEVSSANINMTLDSGETSEIGETWKTMLPLGKSWNMSVSLYYDPDDTVQAAMRTEFISGDGDVAAIQMWEDAVNYFEGAGVITSFNVTKGIGAVDTLAITFEGNGALTYN